MKESRRSSKSSKSKKSRTCTCSKISQKEQEENSYVLPPVRTVYTHVLQRDLRKFMGEISDEALDDIRLLGIESVKEIQLLDKGMIYNLKGLKEIQKPRLLILVDVSTHHSFRKKI